MKLSYISLGIWIHCLVMAPLLIVIFLKLRRRGLLNWLSAGFWAWGSMALYFLITPMIQYFGDPVAITDRVALTEGLSRMIWVTTCVALGMSVFFLAYFKTRPGQPQFSLPQDSWPLGTWVVIILALAGTAYSLITFSGSYGFQAEQVQIVDSKYVGGTIGYETMMYMFAPFIIVLLILRRSTRILGYGVLGLYLVGRLDDPYNRVTAVSLVLAVSMVATGLRARNWPPRSWIAIVLVFTLLLWARGHASFTDFQKSGQSARENLGDQIKQGDSTSMLANLYINTYMVDKSGYTYGAPLVSGLLFGPLPRKYFPWKDWLTNQFLPDYRKIRNPEVFELMYGSKSTVIGDLYGYGNIIAILIGMPLLGFLTRKLDGWVAPEAPMAVRALGYVWLGYYFMIYGSSLIWGMQAIYDTGIPFLGVVICAKLFSRRKEYGAKVTPPGLAPGKPSI